jgi:hypothetical protein
MEITICLDCHHRGVTVLLPQLNELVAHWFDTEGIVM